MGTHTRRVKVRHYLPGPPHQEWNADAKVCVDPKTGEIAIKVQALHDGGYLELKVK